MPENPFTKKEQEQKKRMLKRQAATTCKAMAMRMEPQTSSSPPMTKFERTWASSLKTEQVEALVNGTLDDVIVGAIRTVVQEEITR